MTAYRKKLIEVALPLDAINRESAREKSIRHGHPSTLHLWWARRPLASCRAVIFSSLVDDPDEPKAPKAYLEALDKLPRAPGALTPDPSPTGRGEKAGREEDRGRGENGSLRREKLFYFIERLVKWESTTDETILSKARELIMLSCEGKPPPVLDPFCGGGSIPLEAQRLGLEAYASDLNPVAVLITKALIEIPPKFAGRPPVNPDDRAKMGADAVWKGAAGLAADVRYYGKWMRERAWERIGHLYPKGPKGETVIAWLWARTVKCPNPACGAQMPLVKSFWLSTKPGRKAWVEPVVDRVEKMMRFEVRTGTPADVAAVENGSGFVAERGKKVQATFRCLICSNGASNGIAKGDYIDEIANASGLGTMGLAKVAEGRGGRTYLPPDQDEASRLWDLTQPYFSDESFVAKLPHQECRGTFASNAQGRRYGFKTFSDYFTPRQLVALTTFSDLVAEAREQVLEHSGGHKDYADAIATYLAFAVDRSVDRLCTLATWQSTADFVRGTFARQAIPMVWDFADANPFSSSTSNWLDAVEWVAEVIDRLPLTGTRASAQQLDAASTLDGAADSLIATDPPYYNNVGYADLSDFFYVWLRRTLSGIYPDLFSTLLTPKTQELVASPYRFNGDKGKAERHFEDGLGKAFGLMRRQTSSDYPLTLYYAFKQAESSEDGTSPVASTGWQTMLTGLLAQGLEVVGTWPMRTERGGRMIDLGTNALASSIVLVCRPRPESAPAATFKQFQSELAREVPAALAVMTGRERQHAGEPWVDPIDLRQAAIGPGMAVYSRYSRVQKADGEPLSVREALIEINEAIDRYFDEMEGSLDPTSRFCVGWYRESGFDEGQFGRADVLARATSVDPEKLERAGILISDRGKVRLYKPAEYPAAMSEAASIWELCHRLVGALGVGEEEAARLYNRMPGLAEEARDLAYRLYLEAEKKGRAEDALGYNQLVASWTDIRKRASDLRQETQAGML